MNPPVWYRRMYQFLLVWLFASGVFELVVGDVVATGCYFAALGMTSVIGYRLGALWRT